MLARIAILLTSIAVVQCGLEVQIQPNGAYDLLVNGRTWLQSGKTEFFENSGWWSPLPVVEPATPGKDVLGGFMQTVMRYSTPTFTVHAIVKQYTDGRLVSFTTNFTTGMKQSNSGRSSDTTCSRFPTFKLQSRVGLDLGCMAWGGAFMNNGNAGPLIGSWPATTSTGRGGGPHAIFDLMSTDVLVLTHGSQFISQSFETVNGDLVSGVMGGVTDIPAGFSITTMISYSDMGINNAVTQCGTMLMKLFGKTTAYRDADPVLRLLGYNTDHGSYYYYHPAPNMTMGDTMLAVHEQARVQQIPFKFILLDSWWYYKGSQKGVTNWTATPITFFPGGDNALKTFTDKTEWKVIGNNRFWDRSTPYSASNGGSFTFSDDGPEHFVVPMKQDFWNYLLGKSKMWGLTTYQQDWLLSEFNNVPALQRSATMGRNWLMQMGRAAMESGMTIQYSMPYARHVLQSVEIPVVTHVRASDDYTPGGDTAPGNWDIGGSSILAHAVGLAPFKSNFWTSTQEPGGSCGNTTNPDVWRAAAVATLSNGPVTPADGMPFMNKSMIMRSCRNDGMLLRPSRPMTYLDSYIYKKGGGTGPKGHVWSTYTTIGADRYDIVFAMVETQYGMKLSELTLDRETGVVEKTVCYTRNTKSFTGLVVVEIQPANGVVALKPPNSRDDFDLLYFAPIQSNGWALLGELSKWVPVSTQRVVAVTVRGDVLAVAVQGAPHEEVALTFYRTTPIEVRCRLSPTGYATLTTEGCRI
eukprot:TRINITY_DN2537_c5_g1_i1.p1 TRINITY_DN2537_c5_g1~~TRINITY_DN2537_c5_g1_i1.p1  ORF type:complete len:749 (+),score=180.35 TRINITY_DN2537_c5_g1_i1:68-2314(+)